MTLDPAPGCVEVCTLARGWPALDCHRMRRFPPVVFMILKSWLAQVMHWIFQSSSALLIHQFTSLETKAIRRNGNLGFLCNIMILTTQINARIVKQVEGFVDLLVWISHLLVFAGVVLTPPQIVLGEVSN